MTPPAPYRFRPPAAADLEAIAALLAAEDDDRDRPATLGVDFVREVWSRPGFDLAADAWVVTDGTGAAVAYGQVRREEPEVVGSWGVVQPKHRGRGIGSALLDRIETRAAEVLRGVPSGRLRHSIAAGDDAAEAMLRSRGLRPLRHFWHMRIELDGPVATAPDPEGIRVRPVDATTDLAAVHAVLEAAFDWGGERPPPFEAWLREHEQSPTHDPTLWLLAWDGSRPVGALTASEGEEGASIDWLAVVRSHRGRGIGAALLRRSFARLADRGAPDVMVSVDAENPTGATALYERVGMRVVNRWDLWERPVDVSVG
ncbi:MAG TPA: GNAT family N-acetyltransferase [Actinomycetota bacterium]|nr:GNAT family N-acetyltransferase [Actinomycetota bacterium]